MAHADNRRLISHCFDKLHDQLSALRSHVESLRDPDATKLLEDMEFGLFAPMRKLRIHLNVPYDWHEEQPTAKEAVR